MSSLMMPPPKKGKPAPLPEPDADDEGMIGTEAIRVSSEVAYICRWLKRLEKGRPKPAQLIDWAALDNLRLRFAPHAEKAKRLEQIEREKAEQIRREMEGEGPG